MAKMTHCVFCGKELSDGLFKGDANYLSVTKMRSVPCCDDCCKTFDMNDKRETARFTTKLENYMKANGIRKLNDAQVAELYLTYFREREENIARNGLNKLTEYSCFFRYGEEGLFCTEEVLRGSVDSIKAQIKLIDRQQKGIANAFGAEDVSQLRYRLTSKLGNHLRLFSNTFLFEVHLNDPKVMTYSPSVTYFSARGIGILPFMMRKHAEEMAECYMLELKGCIGSHVPVEKVKKF